MCMYSYYLYKVGKHTHMDIPLYIFLVDYLSDYPTFVYPSMYI